MPPHCPAPGHRNRAPTLSIGHCGLGQAHALLGEREAALAELRWLEHARAADQAPPYQLAMLHARLAWAAADGASVGRSDPGLAAKDADASFAALEDSGRSRDLSFICAPIDPAFDTLRLEPRFAALLRRHGLGHLVQS